MDRLEADYQYCEKIIRKYSKTFFRAFSLLPQAKARAVYAVYAFCRAADDAVDIDGSGVKLSEIERSFTKLLQGEPENLPLWRALQDVFSCYAMNSLPFYDMLKGQRLDLAFHQPETMDELDSYCYYVAGTVGGMLLPVLAEEHHRELGDAALFLGRAMQITNILRDVGEDLRLGRIYLPRSLMEKYGCTEKMLRSEAFATGCISLPFTQLWEDLAAKAEDAYCRFEENLGLFDPDSRLPILLSGRLYGAILDAVRSSGYDCITKRNSVSREQKKHIILLVQREAAV